MNSSSLEKTPGSDSSLNKPLLSLDELEKQEPQEEEPKPEEDESFWFQICVQSAHSLFFFFLFVCATKNIIVGSSVFRQRSENWCRYYVGDWLLEFAVNAYFLALVSFCKWVIGLRLSDFPAYGLFGLLYGWILYGVYLTSEYAEVQPAHSIRRDSFASYDYPYEYSFLQEYSLSDACSPGEWDFFRNAVCESMYLCFFIPFLFMSNIFKQS